MTGPDLSKRLRDLSESANPGPYGVISYGSGKTYLTLGSWVGHYASNTVPMMGGGRAEIVNSNIPSDWGARSDKKGATAHFLSELANAYRSGKLVVADDPAVLAALPEVQALIRQAVEAEREACADVLHDEQVQIWADEIMYDLHHAEVLNIRDYDDKITAVEYVRAALRNIAAAIRKRGKGKA